MTIRHTKRIESFELKLFKVYSFSQTHSSSFPMIELESSGTTTFVFSLKLIYLLILTSGEKKEVLI